MMIHWISRETKVTTDISSLLSSVVLNGEYRGACRTLDIEIVESVWDITIPNLEIKLGDNIGLLESDKLMFYGVVWSISKSTTGTTTKIHCKDFGIYLLKNKYNYKFKGMTPEAITRKLCNDYGIEVGHLAATDEKINRNFVNSSLYDMIMTSYTLANNGEYIIRFTGKALNVIEKGEIVSENKLEKWNNLLTASSTETIEEMVNTVYVRDDEDKNLIDTIQNKDDLKYGLLSEVYKKEKDKDYHEKVNKMLKGVDYKIEVTNFGDPSCITGNAVMVEEHWTKLLGKFYIDGDTHTWKDGLYTNKLVLNFKNLMNEMDSGSEPEEDNKKNSKDKGKSKGKKGKKKKESNLPEFKYIYKP